MQAAKTISTSCNLLLSDHDENKQKQVITVFTEKQHIQINKRLLYVTQGEVTSLSVVVYLFVYLTFCYLPTIFIYTLYFISHALLPSPLIH